MEKSDLSPHLKTGVTRDSFQTSGNLQEVKIILKIAVNGFERIVAQSLTRKDGIKSGPAVRVAFSLLNAFLTVTTDC